jgi:hypothetical protein
MSKISKRKFTLDICKTSLIVGRAGPGRSKLSGKFPVLAADTPN